MISNFFIVMVIIFNSMGAVIYNSAQTASIDSANTLTSIATQSFNSIYETSFGDNQPRSKATALISKVITNNKSDLYDSIISINGITDENELSELLSKMKSETATTKYIINGDYDTNGLISNINITKK